MDDAERVEAIYDCWRFLRPEHRDAAIRRFLGIEADKHMGADNPQHADDFYSGVSACLHNLSDVPYELLPPALSIDSRFVFFGAPCPMPHLPRCAMGVNGCSANDTQRRHGRYAVMYDPSTKSATIGGER